MIDRSPPFALLNRTVRPGCQVVDRIEAIMHVKAYNQLGGLQLDRNVRALVATLSDITQKTVLSCSSVVSYGAPGAVSRMGPSCHQN